MTMQFPANTTPRPAVRPQAVLARDWLKTLWPASYKGVPFKVEYDEERGSRRIVEHEFPMRDDPFLEDLGEGVRRYRVTAYVASDSADGDAAAVIAACAMRGPGALVLPTHGPIIVRCIDFGRHREKDRHGYIALELRFTREGFASALASVANLANQVFVQAEATAAAIASAFVAAVSIVNQADYVIGAVSDRVLDGLATLEAVRTSTPLDTTVSSAQRNAIQALYSDVPTMIESPTKLPAVAQGVVAIARALGDGMTPPSAKGAFEAIVTDPSFSSITSTIGYPTVNRRTATTNANAAYQLLRLAALTAYAEAIARMTFSDRQSAITTRANVAELFDNEASGLLPGDIELVHAIGALRDKVVTFLSRTIIDLAPVVKVEANLSMTSLFWSWRLYKDPNRATELVERNQLPVPSLFPLTFEALAPSDGN